ncbi:MAG: Regulator of chromosome condensation (RCC1) repeat protein [Candidatus Izimaplasma bacterium HR2]|nr:MAG: Regulator of chromosome condensation (RCC1) repeat protein [Candidatus Izimaplasma bacterium HR2]
MKRILILLLIVTLSIINLTSNEEVLADMIQSEEDTFSYYEYYDFVQIELGDQHSAVLTSDGRVFTWGDNAFSQLGDGTSAERHIPTEITSNFNLNTGEKIESIFLGYVHSAALSSEGRVFTWGYNGDGALGDGTTSPTYTPIDITDNFNLNEGETISNISLGHYHSSAITSDGRIFTWGYNEDGAVGDGTLVDKLLPLEISSHFNLNEGEVINSISLNGRISSAITSEDRVFTWGYNFYGQLGDNTIIDKIVPTDITSYFNLNEGESITSIELGGAHSSAISSEDRVFTWGANGSGQLGDGTVTQRNIPTEITDNFNLIGDESISSIELGGGHSFALSSNDRVFAWGSNHSGQLGDGTTVDKNLPIDITSIFDLDSLETITSISLGGSHSFVLSSDNIIFIWGRNFYGQVGDDSTTNRYTPIELNNGFYPVYILQNPLFINDEIISYSLGANHTLVLTNDERVLIWGQNDYGQLGDGTTTDSANPIDITSRFNLGSEEDVLEVYLGGNYSILITTEGRIFTWGINAQGQLGDGTTTNSNIPIEITSNFYLNPDETFVSISAGGNHSSVITSEGRVFMWGYNTFGQLGDGTDTQRNLPVDITDNFNLIGEEIIENISLGGSHSSAVTSDNRVFIWGYNGDGQLGIGVTDMDDHPIPIDITDIFNLNETEVISDIFLGGYHSSVITSEGRILIWGDNEYHQLADENSFDRNFPIDITTRLLLNEGEVISTISLGNIHSSAVTTDDRIFTWGGNWDGMLGDGTTTTREVPTDITSNFDLFDGETVIDSFLGYYHSSAITSNGRIFTWGRNGDGQLGDGTTVHRHTPISVNHTADDVDNVLFSYMEKEINGMGVTIKFSVFPEFDYKDGLLSISVNGTEYDNSSFTVNNGRINVYVTNSWNVGDDVTLTIDTLTFTNNEIIIPTGELSASTTLVDDTTPPTFNTITEQTIEAGVADIDWITLITNEADDSGGPLTKYEVEDNIDYDTPEIYTVTVKLVDESSNETSQTFNVEVEDTTAPTFDTIDDQSIDDGVSDIDWSTYIINPADNSDGVLTKVEVTDNVDYDTPGTYTVTVKLVDESLNETSQEFNVEVEDITPPTFDTITEQTIEAGVSDTDWTTLIINEADDSGGPLTKVEVTDNVDYDTPGTYTVTVKLVDESQNETSKEFNVIVEDTTHPEATVLYDQSIEVGTADIDWTTYITETSDNSDGEITVTEDDNVIYNVLGEYAVTVTVGDEYGNSYGQTIFVTVEDTTPPTFDNIINQTIEAGVSDIDWTTLITNESDNISGTLTKEEVTDNVDYDTPGTYTVTVKVVDESLNETSQEFSVIVEDTIAPTFDTIEDQTIEAGVSDIDWATLITNESDNSDNALTKIEVEDNVDYDTPGTYTVIVKLSDGSLNEISQEFDVIVEDTTAPTFDTITEQTIEAGVSNIDWATLITNELDNSDDTLSKIEVEDNVDYDTPGTYTVIVKLVDESSNEISQQFNVVVEDTTAPLFDEIIEQTIEAGVTNIDWTTLITNESDNSDGVLSKVEVEDNVDYDTPGIYTVTVKLLDESLNETSREFDVIVEDTTDPIITGATDIEYILEDDIPDYIDGVSAIDIVDGDLTVSIIVNDILVDYDTIGTYTVTYSVMDYSNNEQTFIIEIIVKDVTPPELIVSGSEEVTLELGELYTEPTATCTDNYDSECVINTDLVIDQDEIGNYLVTYSVEDSSGNLSEVFRTVIIQDTTPPTVSLNSNIDTVMVGELYIDSGITYEDFDDVIVTLTGEVDTTTPGTYILTYSAEDTSGNITVIKRAVTVVSLNPTIEFELGDALTSIKVGEEFIDGTCKVFVNNIESNCEGRTDNINTSEAGIYTIEYSYSHNEKEYTYIRYIFVYEEGNDLTLYYRKQEEEGVLA